MSTLVDCKQRELKVGQKVKIVKNIPSVVTDGLGKIWWIEPSAVSASFL